MLVRDDVFCMVPAKTAPGIFRSGLLHHEKMISRVPFRAHGTGDDRQGFFALSGHLPEGFGFNEELNVHACIDSVDNSGCDFWALELVDIDDEFLACRIQN